MEALDGCLLDRAVHSLDLAVGPGMLYLSQPVLDPMLAAHAAKDVLEGGRVAASVCELYAIVGQYLMCPLNLLG